MLYSFTSPVDQDIVVTLDYQNERQIPKGCPKDKVWYNMYLKWNGGKPLTVSTQTGYGMFRVSLKKGQKQELKIINWEDASFKSHFYLTGYGTKGKIAWSEKK